MLTSITSRQGDAHFFLTENIQRIRKASYNNTYVVITFYIWPELAFEVQEDTSPQEVIDIITPHIKPLILTKL